MKILLADQVVKRLQTELMRAGAKEIGGLLMGEDVGDGAFRVVGISVQRSGGTHTCFVRNPNEHQAYLEEFFARTGQDYTRFNYLGEWHSHPSFEPLPSATDIKTMQSIVGDPEVGVNFLALLVVRQVKRRIEATATVFMRTGTPVSIPVSPESEGSNKGWRISKWLRQVFNP
jgi:integrative and conjugative element protein (TIGR02256 family)